MSQADDQDPWRRLSISVAPSIGLVRTSRNADYGEECYSDFDLWIGVAGHGTVELAGQDIDFCAGVVVLAMPGVPIRQRTDSRTPIEVAYVHFNCFINGRRVRSVRKGLDTDRLTLRLSGMPPICVVAKMDTMPLVRQLMAARALLSDDVTRLGVNILLLQVMQRMRLACARSGEVGSPEPSRVDRAMQYMHKHLDGEMRLEDVAAFIDVSLPTLRRLFQRQLRISPGRYLHHLRMGRARDLLGGGNFSVGEAARECGFNSAAFFSRVFKAEHGMSPREYSRHSRALP